MNKLYSLLCAILWIGMAHAQTTVVTDDFESGLGAWTLTGEWGLATSQAYNGSNSLADSPSGQYLNMQTTYATLTNSFNLSSALDANVYMQVKYDIENGFDYCYMEMSSNNGSTWTNVYTFNGENNLANWTNLSVNAGGFVGNSQVKIRFRFYTDAAYQADGIFIDSFRIVSDTVDNAPPLIVHDPDPHFEGQLDTNFRDVTITDISGVASAIMTYTVDNGPQLTLSPIDTVGDVFTYAIPPQDPGAYVDYFVSAVDSAPAQNGSVSQIYQYISGNYISHDNAVVNTVANFTSTGALVGVANRITLDGLSQVTTALLRNYTDVNNPNDSIEFHIWTNNNGTPGTDIITPFNVFPEANLLEPQRMTRIDLRPYETQLDSMEGNIFIGFEVPQGSAWVCQTTGSNGRGYTLNNSNNWNSSTTTYHFRAITSEPLTPPDADFSYDSANDPTIDFMDESTGDPIAWHWDFGDGDTSIVQNPSHTYQEAGNYSVCLTATNNIGESAPYCEQLTIANSKPNALFVINVSQDPTIVIDEFSQYNPTSWDWDFGDGNTSTVQEPTHTYGSAGQYEVCLIASNQYGSDTACQTADIVNELPIPLFTYEVQENNIVSFDNMTATGTPPQTDYVWYFDINNDSSDAINPVYNYPDEGGTYNVCLKASNAVGTAPLYCADVDLNDLTGITTLRDAPAVISPNPADDLVLITPKSGTVVQSLRLIGIDGRLIDVKQQSMGGNIQLDVSQLNAGVYFIEIATAEGSANKLPLVIR